MKNIEFYYDDLTECESFDEIVNFMFSIDVEFKGEEDIPLLITWLNEEHKLLNEKEKEYLSSVIKPFRKAVESISKERYNNYCYFIRITLKNGEKIELPLFDPLKDMYIGMDLFQEYTLEELGL